MEPAKHLDQLQLEWERRAQAYGDLISTSKNPSWLKVALNGGDDCYE